MVKPLTANVQNLSLSFLSYTYLLSVMLF